MLLWSLSHVLLFLVVMHCAWKSEHYKEGNIKANVCLHAINHEPDRKLSVSESQRGLWKPAQLFSHRILQM